MKWKKYDEYHEVSDCGDIRLLKKYGTYKKGYIFKQNKTTKKGYKRVHIQGKGYMVHRLVAELFVYNDNPLIKTEVNHINFDRTDNRAENLEWVSHSENIQKSARENNAYNFGRFSKELIDTTTGELYDSAKCFAQKHNITTSSITNSIRRGHRCCGCKLKYTGNIIRYNKKGKLLRQKYDSKITEDL